MANASIGLDLGGTTYSLGWLDQEGRLRDLVSLETHSYRPPAEIVADLARATQATVEKARLAGYSVIAAGIGVPAVIDPWAGKVLLPPNFAEGWHGLALAAQLRALTGLPTWLVNDARAFTFAESRLGAGRGYSHLLGIT
ncbi:MAG: ROK family protein, partial [Meiothermus silvanus]|nr:ROK family protein [Allomeiothermus silvanus]